MKRFFVARMVVMCVMAQGLHAANVNIWQLAQSVLNQADVIQEKSSGAVPGANGCTFFIHQSNIPLTITQPGNYCLAENITFTGNNSTRGAINVVANDVNLDLQGHTIFTTGSGPCISFDAHFTNHRYANGFLSAPGSNGINNNYASIGAQTVVCSFLVENVYVVVPSTAFNLSDNVEWHGVVKNCAVRISSQNFMIFLSSSSTTINHTFTVENCFCTGGSVRFSSLQGGNFCVRNTIFTQHTATIQVGFVGGVFLFENLTMALLGSTGDSTIVFDNESPFARSAFINNIISVNGTTPAVDFSGTTHTTVLCKKSVFNTISIGIFAPFSSSTPFVISDNVVFGASAGNIGFEGNSNPKGFFGANVGYQNSTNYDGVNQPISTTPSATTKYWTNLSA